MENQGHITFQRRPREAINLPSGSMNIDTPPNPSFPLTPLNILLLVVMLLTIIVPAFIAFSTSNYGLLAFATPGLFLLYYFVSNLEKINQDHEQKKLYNQYLNELENDLISNVKEQRDKINELYPNLQEILTWSNQPNLRLWERRKDDPEFLHIRLGLTTRPSLITINDGIIKVRQKIPLLKKAKEIYKRYQNVDNCPDWFDLQNAGIVGIVGNLSQTTELMHGFICQLTALHSPEAVMVIASHSNQNNKLWKWVGWLPHTRLITEEGGLFPLISSDIEQQHKNLTRYIEAELQKRKTARQVSFQDTGLGSSKPQNRPAYMQPALVWFIEDFNNNFLLDSTVKKVINEGPDLGILLITASNKDNGIPENCGAVVTFIDENKVKFNITRAGGKELPQIFIEKCNEEAAEKYALALAPRKPIYGEERLPTTLRLLELLEIAQTPDGSFDPLPRWKINDQAELRIPIGRTPEGQVLYLDLNNGVHGPHGVIGGMPGSGKSELIQTIICSLALNNHPEHLNFILMDFGGGITIEPFKKLPHVAGLLTEQDLQETYRIIESVEGEIDQRLALLVEEKVNNIKEYNSKTPKPAKPFPYLVVIIDEFTEMKEKAQELYDKLGRIARLGRKVGIHLIMATQRPDGAVNVELSANVQFYICLRVANADQSRSLLGTLDAYKIASDTPGRGYFKVGQEVYTQFQAARVGASFITPLEQALYMKNNVVFVSDSWQIYNPVDNSVQKSFSSGSKRDYDMITDQCESAADSLQLREISKPWKPQLQNEYYLEDFLNLQELLKDQDLDKKTGMWHTSPDRLGYVPVAVLDDLYGQKQYPFYLDFSKHGSYCITGLPGTGRTTFLRTILTGLMLTHPPNTLEVFIIDLGDSLTTFKGLPHLKRGDLSFISSYEVERLPTVFAKLTEEIKRRRLKLLGRNWLTYNEHVSDPLESLPLIFVALDNYTYVAEGNLYTAMIKDLVAVGRQCGLYLAITMDRVDDFSYSASAQQQFFQVALEQPRDDLVFEPKPSLNRLGSWNNVPGRGFIRLGRNSIKIPGDHPQPHRILEIQTLLPVKASARLQTTTLEKLLTSLKQFNSSQNQAWQNEVTISSTLSSSPFPSELIIPTEQSAIIESDVNILSLDKLDGIATEDEDLLIILPGLSDKPISYREIFGIDSDEQNLKNK
jgi:S-DNA-T family DNA segregation ATPase FtsK/SpoIIIE